MQQSTNNKLFISLVAIAILCFGSAIYIVVRNSTVEKVPNQDSSDTEERTPELFTHGGNEAVTQVEKMYTIIAQNRNASTNAQLAAVKDMLHPDIAAKFSSGAAGYETLSCAPSVAPSFSTALTSALDDIATVTVTENYATPLLVTLRVDLVTLKIIDIACPL